MKLLKTLILVVVLLLGLSLAAGFFMEPQWRVERQTQVAEAPGPLFTYISQLPNWPQWTAWNSASYPDMQISYSGPASGVGARQSWNDGAMTGFVEVTAFEPGQAFAYRVSMDAGQHEMHCRLSVDPADGGSNVSWSCSGNSGSNPLARLMMAAYRPLIARDFQTGLERLRQRYQPGGAPR